MIEEINECEVNNGGCDHNCTNLNLADGGYVCSCEMGFSLGLDQHSCIYAGRCVCYKS